MPVRAILPIALFVLLSAPAQAEPEVDTQPVPDWVEHLEIEEFAGDRSGEFQFGVAYLLSDRQVRRTNDGYDYYERLSYRIIDRSGMEQAATITRPFNPANETLAFHFIRIVRDGQVVDRLADAEITLLRQEHGLSSSLIDGNITALIQLTDVRVGDVIDYAFGGNVVSALWPTDLFASTLVEWMVPVAQLHFKLSVPEDLQIAAHGVATEVQPQVERSNGWKSFRVHVRDPDPVRIEQNVPNDWMPIGKVVFSTMDSWSEIADWALPLFSVGPVPGGFAAQLDDIAKAYHRIEDRALHTLRLIQEDIRYLGIEVGLGSYVPRPPSVTIERGYGDCKDKSVLLVAALEYLGIDAVPVLVSTMGGVTLPKRPPTIDSFDHVIVRIDIGERSFWVDPTLTHEGGKLETLASLDYGYVLPIIADQSELVEIDVPIPGAPVYEIIETFEFPESEQVGLRLQVEYIHRDLSANAMRRSISGSGQVSLSRGFLDYYAANYAGLTETSPLAIDDDRDANALTFRAEYEMSPESLRDGNYANTLPVYATAVQDILVRQVEADRNAPLWLPFGTNARHTIRVKLPGRRLIPPENTSKSVSGVSYSRTFRQDSETFEIEYVLAVTEDVAEPGSIRSVTDLADEVADQSEVGINLDQAVPALAQLLDLPLPLDPEMETAVLGVISQVAASQYVKALASLNELVSSHQEPDKLRGFLQLMRAVMLDHLGRRTAALEAFEEAFLLYESPDARSYLAYIGVLIREGEDAQAVAMIARLLKQEPHAVNDFKVDWISHYYRHLGQSELKAERDKLVVAIARALHETRGGNFEKLRWMMGEAVEALSRSGDIPEAALYLPHIMDPELLAGLLSKKETEALWSAIEREAGANLSDAMTRYVEHTRAVAAAAPDDFRLQRRYLEALRMAGHNKEAVDFGEPIVSNWPLVDAAGEDAYWFVNEFAYVLSYGGFPDKADALMSKVVDLGISRNRSLISMAINRVQLLLHWGDFEAALAAVDDLESLDDSFASDYGWMWILSAKACALHQLERTEEARMVLDDSIMPIAASNPAAHTKTLLCLEQLDKAAEVLVGRLTDEAQKESAIRSFIETGEPEVLPPFLGILRKRAEQVRGRPEVRAEFAELARVVSMSGSGSYWGRF